MFDFNIKNNKTKQVVIVFIVLKVENCWRISDSASSIFLFFNNSVFSCVSA